MAASLIPQVPAEMLVSKPCPEWRAEEAFPQPFYVYNKDANAWDIVHGIAASTSGSDLFGSGMSGDQRFRLVTWNIDCLMPYVEERMAAGLDYLSSLYKSSSLVEGADAPGNIPMVIMLQEMVTSDLSAIQAAPWIRENFYITDLSSEFWASAYYGTVTLIDKHFSARGSVERVFRAHYSNTNMQRDGLFVDLTLPTSDFRARPPFALTLCNTHLESLVSNPPKRPGQLALAAGYMKAAAPRGVTQRWFMDRQIPHAAVLAGDLNAFMPEDTTSVTDAGLLDAYLVLGGKDGSDEGYTWGQQAPEALRKAYGCSRMDKVLYCGALRCENIIRIGEGVLARGVPEKETFVSDHLGLMAEFVIEDTESRHE